MHVVIVDMSWLFLFIVVLWSPMYRLCIIQDIWS